MHPLTSLQRWFTFHCIVDVAVAIPLFIFPEYFLSFLGWTAIDPLMSRVVASALFGIGGISFLARNSSTETFQTLLTLKIIWSLSAIVGIVFSLFHGNYPDSVWIFLLLFIGFSAVWIYYKCLFSNTKASLR